MLSATAISELPARPDSDEDAAFDSICSAEAKCEDSRASDESGGSRDLSSSKRDCEDDDEGYVAVAVVEAEAEAELDDSGIFDEAIL